MPAVAYIGIGFGQHTVGSTEQEPAFKTFTLSIGSYA
jgi:hypothetical protein